MATVTLRRSDLFPVGTTVALYPATAQRAGAPPTAAPVASASAAVDADGLLTITHANVLGYTPYVAYAAVGGEHRYARVRSTAAAHGSVVRGRRGSTTSWPAAVAARRAQDGTA
jgi:hypothetical protein